MSLGSQLEPLLLCPGIDPGEAAHQAVAPLLGAEPGVLGRGQQLVQEHGVDEVEEL